MQGENATGVFYDSPVQGLRYVTKSHQGTTDKKGTFEYCEGETITFYVGDFVLGTIEAAEFLTPAHLVIEVGGRADRITNRKVTNMARFLQSLNPSDNLEERIVITDSVEKAVNAHRYEINFDQTEDNFAASVKALMDDLGSQLRTGAEARNHLRRSLLGIKKMTDVKIPLSDGAYALADIFMPIEPGEYPVIMSYAGYGKAFWFGCVANEEERLERESQEDRYFQGQIDESGFIPFHIQLEGKVPPPDEVLPPIDSPINPRLPHISEHFERANSVDWVPEGYIVIHVDGRGTGCTPGKYVQYSVQERQDFYDSIEWAGAQPWSNGNVGLYGASYYAINAFSVAALQPPSLKAMIALAGDGDPYRDVIYGNGGLYNPFNFVAHVHCANQDVYEWVDDAKKNTFYDPALYGPQGSINVAVEYDKIKVPFWTSIPLEAPVHTRGSSEFFTQTASEHKKMTIISEPGIHFWMYAPEHLRDHLDYMDYWLKGANNEIMDRAPVEVMMRGGGGSYYWLRENEWPLARTDYSQLELGILADENTLGQTPSEDGSITYAADGKEGVVFSTGPLEQDIALAGHVRLKIWAESTSKDMAINTALRALDENGEEVIFSIERSTPTAFGGGHPFPLAKGGLKVSHRKLDPEKTTEYRPYHTHLKEDYQPLSAGEIVECDIEFLPMTGHLKKGWTLQLLVMPGEDVVEPDYQQGAQYTVHVGPSYPSYLQLPVIPQ